MAITREEFIPRPGIVNKQGRLPDPKELICIEVPKVFDQCLIKRCLKYKDCDDVESTAKELRSNPLVNPRIFIGCRNFNLKLLSVEKIPLPRNHDFKEIILNFVISFCADYIDAKGQTRTELFDVPRTEKIPRMYCPDPIAQISANYGKDGKPADLDTEIIKLEMVADCLTGEFCTTPQGDQVLDVTIGVYLIVKCELMVQLLIPNYGYCPAPKPCPPEPIVDPCTLFDNAPVPSFFPKQLLDPLFDDEETDC